MKYSDPMTRTAIVHPESVIKPTKLELAAAWLPKQPWFSGTADDIAIPGRFRFTDPAGEVGIETLLVTSRGVTYQMPVTYRGAPLDGAESSLITTMDHSILGPRWVYDAPADPVYVAEVLRVIAERDTEVELSAGVKSAYALGSGLRYAADPHPVPHIVRVLDGSHVPDGFIAGTLTARWTDDNQERQAILVIVWPSSEAVRQILAQLQN